MLIVERFLTVRIEILVGFSTAKKNFARVGLTVSRIALQAASYASLVELNLEDMPQAVSPAKRHRIKTYLQLGLCQETIVDGVQFYANGSAYNVQEVQVTSIPAK